MHLLPLLSLLIPTVTSTPLNPRTTCPTTNIIVDPGFESGVAPPTSGGTSWTVNNFIGASTYSLTSPGSTLTPSGGKYAFTATLYPGPYSSGNSGDDLVQTMKTCAGKNYSITADFRFNATAGNACSIALQYPGGSVTTGSGSGGIVAGMWYRTSAFFQAVSSADKLTVAFRCGGGQHDFISVDNVVVKLFNGNV
ncbi:MAG: hypothetical protein Q9220_002719 [cf. Caloplaca sp. 1 TL-2023]